MIFDMHGGVDIASLVLDSTLNGKIGIVCLFYGLT